jgi:hypothetical protein
MHMQEKGITVPFSELACSQAASDTAEIIYDGKKYTLRRESV